MRLFIPLKTTGVLQSKTEQWLLPTISLMVLICWDQIPVLDWRRWTWPFLEERMVLLQTVISPTMLLHSKILPWMFLMDMEFTSRPPGVWRLRILWSTLSIPVCRCALATWLWRVTRPRSLPRVSLSRRRRTMEPLRTVPRSPLLTAAIPAEVPPWVLLGVHSPVKMRMPSRHIPSATQTRLRANGKTQKSLCPSPAVHSRLMWRPISMMAANGIIILTVLSPLMTP